MQFEQKWARVSRWILGIVAGWTILSGLLALQLGFDYNFENFFPQDDPETEFFKTYRHLFESDNDYIIIGLENRGGVFDPDFLNRADALVDELQALPNVDTVISPTRFETALRDPFIGTVFRKPLLRRDDREALLRDSAKIWERNELIGTFFSADGQSIALQVNHKQYLSKQACDTISIDIERVLSQAPFDATHAVGRSIGQRYYVQTMQRELIVFTSLGILLIITFLWIAFRSAWGIWVPISVVLLSVVWVLGIMKLTGKPIDIMLIILPTIIFVVGMSDVVHILTRYFEELRKGLSKVGAVKVAFKEVGLATLLTSLTTAVGFLTLMTSSIQPIANFGSTTAIGVFVAFVLAFTMLPAVLILSPRPDVDAKPSSQMFWNRQLHRSLRWTFRNKRLILILSGLIIVVSVIGLSRIEVNNFLLEDLKDSDPLKKEFVYFEEHFAGGRPFELAIVMHDGAQIFDRQVLSDLDQLEEYLTASYGVGSIISPARILKTANREMQGGADVYFTIPDEQADIDKLVRTVKRFDKDSVLQLFVNEPRAIARMQGKVGDLGAREFAKRNTALNAYMDEELADRQFDIRITGTANLVDLNNESLAVDMTFGLGIAFIVVALIIGLLFKSIRMVIICLIPNILPLLMIAGYMGFTGIDLKVSTSIIFTIAFGIAVDDTIHFMSKLRLELAKGKSMLYALKRTHLSTGKAIIVTSIILCGGFFTLILSGFLGTFYIGLLVSMTLLFAVMADLFLLPVLIMLFFKRNNK